MSIISYSPEAASQVSDRPVEPKARGIFVFIMSSLHASRRRQAHRVLRRYEHLLTHEPKQDCGERDWSLRTGQFR
jgi:hypothetical protein